MFRDPNQADRVWVIFDWDAAGWQAFVSDPETPVVLKGAGHTSKPSSVALAATCLGDTFSWPTLQNGRLIHNVLPIEGEEAEPKVRRDLDLEVNGKRFKVSMWVGESELSAGGGGRGG